MFELNNLSLAIPSPVEDYFLMVDALEPGQAKADVLLVGCMLIFALMAICFASPPPFSTTPCQYVRTAVPDAYGLQERGAGAGVTF
jgi:hypothetical protein